MVLFSMRFTCFTCFVKIPALLQEENMKKHKTWTNINSSNMVRYKDKDEESSGERKKDQRGWRAWKKAGKKADRRESTSHPVFGEKQIDGGVSDDVHAQLEGLDLSGFSRLCNLSCLHGLVVGRQEELPQTVPEKGKVALQSRPQVCLQLWTNHKYHLRLKSQKIKSFLSVVGFEWRLPEARPQKILEPQWNLTYGTEQWPWATSANEQQKAFYVHTMTEET